MIQKKSWSEFRETGLLWFANTILCLFGWSIVLEMENGKIVDVFPARTGFRGFNEEANTDGYKKVTTYLKDNIDDLCKDLEDE